MDDVIEWSWEPSVVLSCLLLAGGYLACVGPLRGRFRGATAVSPWRVAGFLLGVSVLFLALASPLDDLSDRYLLSAHMIQHVLLTLAMPPLLLLGMPAWILRPLLRHQRIAAAARLSTRPLIAFLAFNVTIAFSHFPIVYNLALEDERLHITLHLAYMVTAVVAWWPVVSPLPELPPLPYPLRMLYLFLNTIPGGLVGALISLADHVIYPTYAAAPRLFGLTALGDQQLGGLIMWLGVSTYYFALMTITFFVWANRDEATLIPSPRGRGLG